MRCLLSSPYGNDPEVPPEHDLMKLPGLADTRPPKRTIHKVTEHGPQAGDHATDETPKFAVDVCVDRSGRIGPLSYLVPRELLDFSELPNGGLSSGTAVTVQMGRRSIAHGFVLRRGDETKATRHVDAVWGQRVWPADLEAAALVAEHYLCDLSDLADRFAPRDHKGAGASQPGELDVLGYTYTVEDVHATRRLLICPPLLDQTSLAACEAAEIHNRLGGQVLILCPTVQMVEETMARFTGGAVRLDAAAPPGDWAAFSNGSAAIGVGTRTAALYSAKHISGIIVVDESHPGHTEAAQPRTHAREIAGIRTRHLGADLVILGTIATPSAAGLKLKSASVRCPNGWPKMTVLDRSEYAPGADRVIPHHIHHAVSTHTWPTRPAALCSSQPAVWRCRRCHSDVPAPASASATAEICELDVPCGTCEQPGTARRTGWDAARVREAFGDRVEPMTLTELRTTTNRGLVIICNLDMALHARSSDGTSVAARAVTDAARAAGSGGHLIAVTGLRDHPELCNLFDQRNLKAVAASAWQAAREAGLPPFLRLVTVSIKGPKPYPSKFPGTVHGPRREGTNWEMVVRCTDAELPRLRAALLALKPRAKLRIHVT
jgi:primosomal protein N'